MGRVVRRSAWIAAACIALGGIAAGALSPPDAAAQSASRRAWLGVSLDKGASGGVIAKHVINNSPASKAGLADGDVIVSADGNALDEPKQLVARVALVGPGNAMNLRIRRRGTDRDVSVSLVPYPGDEQILRLDKLGTFAPAWKSLSAAAGNVPASLASLRGKVVIVDFWATWCGPCRLMAPQLSTWQSTFGAQGLSVIGLTGDPVAAAAQGAQAMNMRYAVASDPDSATAASYGVNGLPTLFLIDKKGVIREVLVGYDAARHKDFEKLIQTLLAEPAPNP